MKVKSMIKEIEELENEKIISIETSERIKKYYSEKLSSENRKSTNSIIVAISIIGALLIGLGIISLVAYNWKELNKPLKTILAILPLLVLQILTSIYIFKGKIKEGFKEGVTTLLCLVFGASLALISQIYQIQGDFSNFLIVWMIIIIPVVYLLSANFSSVIYLILTIIWAGYKQFHKGNAMLFYILGAFILPYIIYKIYKERETIKSSFFSYAISIWGLVAIGIVLEKAVPGIWIVVYSNLIFIYLFIGNKYFGNFNKFNPFKTIGEFGVLVLSYIFTFKFFWKEIGLDYYRNTYKHNNFGQNFDYILLLLVVIITLLIWIKYRKFILEKIPFFSTFPIVTTLLYIFIGFVKFPSIFAMIYFNLFLFFLGVNSLIRGLKEKEIKVANRGLLVISIVILTRFFTSGDFFIAGIAFIIVGSGFLIFNLYFSKKIEKEKV